jgi:hypothetical protein
MPVQPEQTKMSWSHFNPDAVSPYEKKTAQNRAERFWRARFPELREELITRMAFSFSDNTEALSTIGGGLGVRNQDMAFMPAFRCVSATVLRKTQRATN